MAVTDIPARKLFRCDGCAQEVEVGASTTRPAHWTNLHVLQDAYDFQGHAVADGSVKLLLCTKCTTVAVGAVNAAIDARRAALSESPTHKKQEG